MAGPYIPLSPEERRREELRIAAEEQKIKDEEDRIKDQDHEKLSKQLDIRLIDDPNIRSIAIDEMARLLAENGAKAGYFDWRDHRDVPGEAIKNAYALEELSLKQEQQAEQAAQAQPAVPLEQVQEGPDTARQNLIDTAVELREPAQKDQAAAEVWAADAASADRLQHQNGRYNDLKNIDPPDAGDSLGPDATPPEPNPPSPPQQNKGDQNSADAFIAEIAAAGDAPDRLAEMQSPSVALAWDAWESRVEQNGHGHDGQQNSANDFLAEISATPSSEQQHTVESSMMDSMKDQPEQGNTTENSGLMADFVTDETRQEAAAARAQEALQRQHMNDGHTM